MVEDEREQRAIATTALLFRMGAAVLAAILLWPFCADFARLIFGTPVYSGFFTRPVRPGMWMAHTSGSRW